MKWFDGPYAIAEDASISRLGRGEIVLRGRVVVLRCPACAALQFFAVEVQDTPSKPTIARPMQCGNGTCKRCATWFRIEHGTAVRLAAPETPAPAIPPRLKEAGVARPQKLSQVVDTVKEQVFDRNSAHRVR